MKKTLRIVEKFDMQVEWSPGDADWYAKWAVTQTNHMSQPFTSSWCMLKSLVDYLGPGVIESVLELAAGIGAQSLMIQELFAPDTHLIQDLHQESIDHIDGLVVMGELPDTVELRAVDAYSTNALVRSDLIIADMGDITAWRLRPGQQQFELLDRIFKLSPAAVCIAEIGGIRLGLQRERYETMLGEGSCTNYRTYIEALSHHFENTWGYKILEVFHTKQFAKMALVPANSDLETAYTEVPSSPVGVTVL